MLEDLEHVQKRTLSQWQRGRLMPDAQCSQCVVESMHVIVVLVTLSHHDPAL
jgi:hypothetical protein